MTKVRSLCCASLPCCGRNGCELAHQIPAGTVLTFALLAVLQQLRAATGQQLLLWAHQLAVSVLHRRCRLRRSQQHQHHSCHLPQQPRKLRQQERLAAAAVVWRGRSWAFPPYQRLQLMTAWRCHNSRPASRLNKRSVARQRSLSRGPSHLDWDFPRTHKAKPATHRRNILRGGWQPSVPSSVQHTTNADSLCAMCHLA